MRGLEEAEYCPVGTWESEKVIRNCEKIEILRDCLRSAGVGLGIQVREVGDDAFWSQALEAICYGGKRSHPLLRQSLLIEDLEYEQVLRYNMRFQLPRGRKLAIETKPQLGVYSFNHPRPCVIDFEDHNSRDEIVGS
ncbi:hypothetical protein RHSIM_RhsimUnG0097000 [Rhododendron simsii]|uniref:Uncharacterized protein n=1 Tax=Rhododendron simsii TaxID=118357 RepID=A0A834FWB6_RHOSS|nr:hypothetical protein RHSIM_RhsimUnG0097000 [Rhododendron simsii]